MKALIVLMLLTTALLVMSNQAYADKDYDYDQCVLVNLQGVKYDWVSDEITRICRETYLNMISPPKKKKQYNQCLMSFLPGVESAAAAVEIKASCSRRYLK